MQKNPTVSTQDLANETQSSGQPQNSTSDVFVTVSRGLGEQPEIILERKKIIPLSGTSEYNGEIVNNEMHGEGMLTGTAGTYVGEFQNGEAHGNGTYYFKFGAKYEGEWQNSLRHGVGTLTLPGGLPRYHGEWRDDEVCGKGEMLRSDGGLVEGVFDGNFNGIGTITYPDGNVYKGQFRHGERDGMGSLKTQDNESFKGEFRGLTPWEGIMVDIDGLGYQLLEGKPVSEINPETGEVIRLVNEEERRTVAA